MAQMAFQIQAVGVIGGAADLIIGVKSSNIRIYMMSILGSASGMNHITTSEPFTIQDDPILDNLTNEIVDFEVSGIQAMWGDLSFSFKIYKGDGTVAYDESRSVATRGTSMGGFSRSGLRLRLVNPTGKNAMAFAEMLGFNMTWEIVREGLLQGIKKR
jgi:hypothetical protein